MRQKKLIDFFDSRRRERRPLVMASVFETLGSTYSKPGARMLIDENGVFQGMLSGGCLEGDLAIRARQVIETGKAHIASYDLAIDGDELWGLGVGCDGVMRVFLQLLSASAAYEPFATIARLQNGSDRSLIATVIASGAEDVAAGACLVRGAGSEQSFGLPEDFALELRARSRGLLRAGGAVLERFRRAGSDIDVFISPILPVPRVLVLGGGLDAEPVVRFAAELGWRCTVVDHRPAYIDNNDFADCELALCCPADEVHTKLDLDGFDLSIVMSHHLDSDRKYLRQLVSSDVPYVGLLGPAGRRERLLQDLADVEDKLRGRLHGPAGLDIGGRGPAAIALSIVAEMQQHLARVVPGSSGRRAESSG